MPLYRLDLWQRFGVLHEADEEGFDATRALAAHAGMENGPERIDPVVAGLASKRVRQGLHCHRLAIEPTVQRMPHHHQLIKRVTG